MSNSAVKDFILDVFRKKAPATKETLLKLMEIYQDSNNKSITEKYGENLISSFLSIYKFNSYDEFKEIKQIMKQHKVYSSDKSYYSTFIERISKKFFDNSTVDIKWIIEDLLEANHNSYELTKITTFLYTNKKQDFFEILQYIIEISTQNNKLLLEVLIHKIYKRDRLPKKMVSLFDILIYKLSSLSTKSGLESFIKIVENDINRVNNVEIKEILRVWLYNETGKEKYIPEKLQQIFFL